MSNLDDDFDDTQENKPKGQNERYEDMLKSNAESALEALPDDAKDQAKDARDQLVSWLVNMDDRTKNPELAVTEEMANTACNLMEAAMAKLKAAGGGKPIEALQKAFKKLDDDMQLNLMHIVLAKTLSHHAQNAALVTKASDLFLWENTGFHIDGDLNCVFAKVGRERYQAIGFEDGQHYVGTEGSKTLWLRQFGMAVIFPYSAPFHVERSELPSKSDHPQALTDKMRETIIETIGDLENDMKCVHRLSHTVTDDDGRAEELEAERKEFEEKAREGIKLARIRVPLLDHQCDKVAESNPEAGPHLENIEISQLLINCLEFLRMTVDEDSVRRQVEGTIVSIDENSNHREQLLSSFVSSLGRMVPGEGEELTIPAQTAVDRELNRARAALPEVRQLLDSLGEDVDILKALTEVLVLTQKLLDEVRQQKKEEAVDE